MDFPKTTTATTRTVSHEKYSDSPEYKKSFDGVLDSFAHRLHKFSQGWGGPESDSAVDRGHTAHCLEATAKAITAKGEQEPDRAVQLDFGTYKGSIGSVPRELIADLVELAKIKKCSISSVVLPEGLTELPPWLDSLPHIQNLHISKYAGQSLDVKHINDVCMLTLEHPTNADLTLSTGPSTTVFFKHMTT